MVVIITRDVPDRFRGFLASCALELAPGVYTSPDMTAGIRERVWSVLADWFGSTGGSSIVMTWDDPKAPSGQGLRFLGLPPHEFTSYDGFTLIRKSAIPTVIPSAAPPTAPETLSF